MMELYKLQELFMQHEVFVLYACAILVFLIGVVAFFILIITPAPYGRYWNKEKSNIFPVPARMAWFVQEVPAFIVPSVLVVGTTLGWIPGSYDARQLIVLSCFIVHYFQRSFIYSLRINGGKPTQFSMFIFCFLFCSLNGYMQARGAVLLSIYPAESTWTGVRVAIGLTMFLLGMMTNIHGDHVLRNLREPGETGYKIPRGGLYRYVSCANLFGEIVEWFGFAIASWSVVSLAFAFTTLANLAPRAVMHHRFYLKKFDNYPKERKAVIPFLL